MRFTPVSEEEAASAGLWEDGIYDYEVKAAEEGTSRAGNEMIALEVFIFEPKNGARKTLYEYLVASEKAAWKVREFCASCGLLDAYETGSLMEGEMIGRTGICEVGTQPARDNFQAKNVVRRWLQKADRSQAQPAPAAPSRAASLRTKSPAGDIDDDIPF